jgi:hypothetical protein
LEEDILKKWYLDLELRRETSDWDTLTANFQRDFSFEDENPLIHEALQIIKERVFRADYPREYMSWEEFFGTDDSPANIHS